MRPDLLALTDDSLAALANRGIVKRAQREVAEDLGPAVVEADDGTLTATFTDGTVVVSPPGTLIEQATCTCPAAGVCRHRVMLVLAHRQGAPSPVGTGTGTATEPVGPEPTSWTPADFTDDELKDLLGTRVMGQARRALRSGYRARVRRPTPQDPVPAVELSSCMVRFHVPGELGYARVDAVAGARDDAIALAVWAFRSAADVDPDAASVEIDVAVGGPGGPAGPAGHADGATPGSGIEPALPLLADLLADGVVHTGPAAGVAIAQARRRLDDANLRWPIDALDETADQLDAYRARSARYQPAEAAALVAEIVARHRCAAGSGGSLRPGVLGTEESAETPLRLLRLTGLGARAWGDDTTRHLEVYLAHAEAGVVLTIRRRLELGDDEPPSGEELGRRQAGGVRLALLAGANVVTQSALRSANRVMRIAENRLARTTVIPSTGAWDDLPPGLLVTDLDAEATRLAGLAPALVRPRVVAESVRAVAIDEIDDLRYLPGEQRLVAAVRAPTGRAVVSLTHSSAAAGALDALARALGGDHPAGNARFVAGHLRRHAGDVVIEPTAVVVGTTVVVPAFAPVEGAALSPNAGSATAPADPLAAAAAEAIAVSAEVPHRGWCHLPPGWTERAGRAARQLHRVGLRDAAQALDDLATATRAVPGDGSLDRWADTHIRLLVAAEHL